MRWFLALMLSCLPLAAQAQEAKPVNLAIVVSLDRSESIDADEAKAQIDGLVYTLRHSNFRDTVAVGWYGLHRLNRRSFEIANAVMHTTGQGFMMAFQAGGPHAQDRGLEAVVEHPGQLHRVLARVGVEAAHVVARIARGLRGGARDDQVEHDGAHTLGLTDLGGQRPLHAVPGQEQQLSVDGVGDAVLGRYSVVEKRRAVARANFGGLELPRAHGLFNRQVERAA